MKYLLIFLLTVSAFGQNKFFLPMMVNSSNGRPIPDANVDLYTAGTSTKVYDLTYLSGSAGAYYSSGTAIATGYYDIYVNGVSWRTFVYINTTEQDISNIKAGAFVFAAANSDPVDSTIATYRSTSTSASYVANHDWDVMLDTIKARMAAGSIGTAEITILPGDYYGDQEGTENAMFLVDTSNVTVKAYGARMYNANSADGYTVKLVNSNNVHWYGGEVYGNSANQSDLGVGYTFDNCTNWSIKDAYAYDTRSDNFRFRSAIHGIVSNCVADSSSAGRGFLFDREGTAGSLTRGSRNILVSGCFARRQGQAALRYQQAYDITVDGGRFEAPFADGGTRRTVTIANDDTVGVDVDSLYNLSFNGVTFKYGAEIEIKGASGNITFKGCDFYGTKFTVDKADFFTEPVGVHLVIDGCFFDFLDDPDSRFINVGSTLPWPSRIEATNNHFKCRASISRAINIEGNSAVLLRGNTIVANPARGIYLGANVRYPIIESNLLQGTGSGGNLVGMDIYADSASIRYNQIIRYKWGIALREDSCRVFDNVLQGITATGDSGIVQYDATPVDNWFVRNQLSGYSVDIADAGGASAPPTTNNYWDNIGSIGITSRNKWTLGSRGVAGGGRINITDTLSTDLMTTPTFLDTLFWKGTHHLTSNPGGDQLRLASENTIQLIPDGDTQTADFYQIGRDGSSGVVEISILGDSFGEYLDHISPNDSDSTLAVGHNLSHRWGYMALWPVSAAHFDTNKFEGKLGIINHGAGADSMWFYIDGSTRMNLTSGKKVTP